MRRVLALLATSIVISLGLITLLGLLLSVPALNAISAVIIQVAVVTGAVTVLIGVVNLLWVHLRRVLKLEMGWPYSLVLFFAAITVIALTVVERLGVLAEVSLSGFLFTAVQVSVESALSGLLVFFLVYAAARLMRRRVNWTSLLFTVIVLVALVGWLRLPALSGFNALGDWIRTVWASAGARGLLIGVALGVTTAGVRVLMGQDPSYRE